MPLSPVISIPMPYTSTRTPCNLVCGANLSDKYIDRTTKPETGKRKMLNYNKKE